MVFLERVGGWSVDDQWMMLYLSNAHSTPQHTHTPQCSIPYDNWYWGGCDLPYVRHFHMDTAYFHCVLMKYDLCFIESQWNMPYPLWKCLTYWSPQPHYFILLYTAYILWVIKLLPHLDQTNNTIAHTLVIFRLKYVLRRLKYAEFTASQSLQYRCEEFLQESPPQRILHRERHAELSRVLKFHGCCVMLLSD